MKHNTITLLLKVFEYIALIAPTAAYAIYSYVTTLQHTMSTSSKGCFWTLIAVAIIVCDISQTLRQIGARLRPTENGSRDEPRQ